MTDEQACHLWKAIILQQRVLERLIGSANTDIFGIQEMNETLSSARREISQAFRGISSQCD